MTSGKVPAPRVVPDAESPPVNSSEDRPQDNGGVALNRGSASCTVGREGDEGAYLQRACYDMFSLPLTCPKLSRAHIEPRTSPHRRGVDTSVRHYTHAFELLEEVTDV